MEALSFFCIFLSQFRKAPAAPKSYLLAAGALRVFYDAILLQTKISLFGYQRSSGLQSFLLLYFHLVHS